MWWFAYISWWQFCRHIVYRTLLLICFVIMGSAMDQYPIIPIEYISLPIAKKNQWSVLWEASYMERINSSGVTEQSRRVSYLVFKLTRWQTSFFEARLLKDDDRTDEVYCCSSPGSYQTIGEAPLDGLVFPLYHVMRRQSMNHGSLVCIFDVWKLVLDELMPIFLNLIDMW